MARVWPSGVTAIETIVGAVTVSVVLCEMLSDALPPTPNAPPRQSQFHNISTMDYFARASARDKSPSRGESWRNACGGAEDGSDDAGSLSGVVKITQAANAPLHIDAISIRSPHRQDCGADNSLPIRSLSLSGSGRGIIASISDSS